jgi:recombination associated protein RdgC
VGLFKGSLTYAQYYVEGDLPADFNKRALRDIQKRVLTPLLPDDEDLARAGWCKAGDGFELTLTNSDVFYNEYINLGFRFDKWVVPGPMLRAKLREAEASFLAKKGRERMTRIEKKELKDLVSKKLRRQLTPVSRSVDLSWSLQENTVRFFSHSEAMGAHLVDLFYKTFSLKLVAASPYTLAARLGISQAEDAAWVSAVPTLLGRPENGNRRERNSRP